MIPLTSTASVVKTLTGMKHAAVRKPRILNVTAFLCTVLFLFPVAGCSTGDEPSPSATTAPPPVADVPSVVTATDTTIVEEGTTQAPTTTDPLATPTQNVVIDSVEATNPVVIHGRARTFENNVSLRVRDANGGIIAESFTTAQGEMGTHSPFTGQVWVTRDPGGRITAEALEYSAKDGSPQSLVSRSIQYPVETIDATLYFPDQGCTTVNPFKRTIPKSISMARLLVEALIGGPTATERQGGASVAFPHGSAVQGVNLKKGVLTVDFNERLQNVGGSCQAQMIRASVTKTLEALPNVSRVVITAGGSEKLALQP